MRDWTMTGFEKTVLVTKDLAPGECEELYQIMNRDEPLPEIKRKLS